jgi:putative transposase
LSPDFRPKGNTNSDEERKSMAKRRFTEEQILTVVKQLEAGVSTYTVYSWKAKYGGVEPNEAVRLHHLEDENNRLKKLVADLSLDREMMKALLTKKTD